MLTIPRSTALRFRQVLKRALMLDGYRRSWPPVLCQVRRDKVILEAGQQGLAMRLHVDPAGGAGAVAFRADLLMQFEGRDDALVTLESVGLGKGVARWTDGGVPKAVEFDTMPPEEAGCFPDEPRLTPMQDNFMPALAEAIRAAARQSQRVGLTRVLLRGKGGELVASDSKQLLIQRGFPFPWEEDVLIPRIPAPDGRPLGTSGPVGIGRTAEQVVIRVAPWAFALPIDTENPFPGIEAVIPRASATTGRLHPGQRRGRPGRGRSHPGPLDGHRLGRGGRRKPDLPAPSPLAGIHGGPGRPARQTGVLPRPETHLRVDAVGGDVCGPARAAGQARTAPGGRDFGDRGPNAAEEGFHGAGVDERSCAEPGRGDRRRGLNRPGHGGRRDRRGRRCRQSAP
jgi:hypothetical protein